MWKTIKLKLQIKPPQIFLKSDSANLQRTFMIWNIGWKKLYEVQNYQKMEIFICD